MSATKLSIIASATIDTRGIGINGIIPWKIQDDLNFFRNMTMSTMDNNKFNAVVMGRKTWESIPLNYRPLQRRINIILSKSMDPTYIKDWNVTVESSFYDCICRLQQDKKIEHIYVIGGSELYRDAMKLDICETIYMTWIKNNVKCDTFFPTINENNFKVETTTDWKEQTDGMCYQFCSYVRNDNNKQ
jgi:dihydrofolate reductase/thymidylate synthase